MSEKNSTFFSQKNISITALILESIKRWYIILAAIIVGIVITTIYTLGFVTPLYTSTAKLFILSRQSSEYYTSADFNISTYLSNDFAEIIADSAVLDSVAKDTGNKYSVGYLKSAINVSKPENTRILEISVKTPKPKDSKMIVDSICENAKETLVEIMELDGVKIIKKGEVAKNPSSPNLSNNMIFASIIAFFIAEVGIAINFAFNNKISSANDIDKYLDLNVLAVIPYNVAKGKSK